MKKLLTVGLLLVAFGLRAQEAHVIALKSEDAAHAKCTWERLQAAQKEWEEVQREIKFEYLTVPERDPDASNTIISAEGASIATVCADQILSFSGTNVAVSTEELEKCHEQQEKERKEHPNRTYRKGFESGFQFSSDFKYIVPKSHQYTTTGSGNLIFTPSVPWNNNTHCNAEGTLCW